MAKGEIEIDELMCNSCGYCIEFCPPKCLVMGKRFNTRGYVLPEFANREDCTACRICAMMCPQLAIEVFRFVTKEG